VGRPPQRTRPEGLACLGAHLDADVGVEREAGRLARLVEELAARHPRTGEARLASLIAQAALLRHESRGAHFRTDAPQPSPAWRGRIHWRRDAPPTFEEVRV